MLRSFERADFCHSKAKICTEYEVISKIFNADVAEICLSKPYEVRIFSLKKIYIHECFQIVDDVYSAFLSITQNSAAAPITKAGEVNEEPPVADGGIADMEIPADMPAYDGETLE